MINFKYANSFCCEDIRLIENYEAANNDTTQTWNCHHRKETDLGLSRHELIERNLYYDRPASELIFLTKAEHNKLHHTGKIVSEESIEKNRQSHLGQTAWNKGKTGLYHQSEETRKTLREKNSGENNPAYGRTWMNNGIVRVFPKTQEEIEHYRELGYSIGYKLK